MGRTILPIGAALCTILIAWTYARYALAAGSFAALVSVAAAAAAYMAINVGANDVANNMGPAVGAKALKMGTALLVAAAFDLAGALTAGQDVIKTVSQDLLTRDVSLSNQTLILVMIAATLAGALWVNASTFVGAPVSTTHAIVGGVIGAGIAAAGLGAIEWRSVWVIALSWSLSPFIGGLLAAGFHTLIRRQITRRSDKLQAARTWVPVLVGVMAGTFATYLEMLFQRGSPGWVSAGIGLTIGIATYFLAIPWVRNRSGRMENRKREIAKLFRLPLIGAAALLSFAHGANDVANAVGPFAAIMRIIAVSSTDATAPLPFWALLIGAAGLAVGIVCFGPKVIHTIGEQITKLNEIRAFCVALSAAITVLVASAFGLPISSTHVAVGGVFGVGFLREYLAIRNMHGAAIPTGADLIHPSTLNDTPEQALARERRGERRFLVRRLKVARIGAAWVVTLPASAILAAIIYLILRAVAG